MTMRESATFQNLSRISFTSCRPSRPILPRPTVPYSPTRSSQLEHHTRVPVQLDERYVECLPTMLRKPQRKRRAHKSLRFFPLLTHTCPDKSSSSPTPTSIVTRATLA